MPKTQSDLCGVCTYRATCMERSTRKHPKFFCEMFAVEDGGLASPSPPVAASRPTRVNGSNVYRGLCSNCDYRATCRLPNRGDDIWHCEEYR